MFKTQVDEIMNWQKEKSKKEGSIWVDVDVINGSDPKDNLLLHIF